MKDLHAEKEPPIEGVSKIEYAALKYALTLLPEGASGVIYCDNQTVVAHMNSDYEVDQVKEPDHYIVKKMIEDKGLTFHVKWVPRKQNRAGKILG